MHKIGISSALADREREERRIGAADRKTEKERAKKRGEREREKNEIRVPESDQTKQMPNETQVSGLDWHPLQ